MPIKKKIIKKKQNKNKNKNKNKNIINVNVSSSGGSGGTSSTPQQHTPSFQPYMNEIKNSLTDLLTRYIVKNQPLQPTNMGTDENDLMEVKNLDRFIQSPPQIFQSNTSPFTPDRHIPSLEDLQRNNHSNLLAQQTEDYEREYREREAESKEESKEEAKEEEKGEDKPKARRGRPRIIQTPEEEEIHKQEQKEKQKIKRKEKKDQDERKE